MRLFLPFFPDMADDSYATIGLDGPAYWQLLLILPLWRTLR